MSHNDHGTVAGLNGPGGLFESGTAPMKGRILWGKGKGAAPSDIAKPGSEMGCGWEHG